MNRRKIWQEPLFRVLLAILFLLLLTILIIGLARLLRKNRPAIELPSIVQETRLASQMTWVSFGDSITDHGFWQPIVLQTLPFNHVDAGISGTRVAGSTAQAFWTEERLAEIIAYQPDVITILGGTNDFFSDNPIGASDQLTLPLEEKDVGTFLGAYATIVEKLQRALPEVQIFILSTPKTYLSFEAISQNGIGFKAEDYAQACQRVAQQYGTGFVDLSGIPYNASTFWEAHDDGIHPNGQGAADIAQLVVKAFQEAGYRGEEQGAK